MSSEAPDYAREWAKDEEGGMSREEQEREAALNALALQSMEMVNESIKARNQSAFSAEIRRAFRLYNAVSVNPNEDLLDDFEGTRTAVKNGSKVVQNIIRQLTNDGASQLGDMLFPTDQDNYGVLPVYPAKPPLRLLNQPAMGSDKKPLLKEDGSPVTHLEAWEARKESILHRTQRMYQKMDATLDRNSFGALGRKLLRDGALTGTGIVKGPFVDSTKRTRWVKPSDKWEMVSEEEHLAAFKRVSVLDFLPDMSPEKVEDCAYISERGWTLPRELRAMRDSGHYFKDQIDKLLLHKPRVFAREGAAEGDTERLSVRDAALVEDMYTKRYEVFETWADFPVKHLRAVGVKGIPEAVAGESQMLACVIHSQGHTLKVFLNPLKSGELPFSVWCWDEDPTSIFGKGIPILAENCQLIYNAVWRMILDHGGLSAVPMIGLIKSKVSPAEGEANDYSLRGGKVWDIKSDLFNLPDAAKGAPFQVWDIPIHLDQFVAIMEKAEEDAYKLSGVTRIERNQQGVDNAPVTLGATQIFQNNASVPRRRQVRDYDDNITKPVLTRLHTWLMQFEDDEDIKGPMEIEPRGSSVLMQREVNTQNLMQLYALTGNGATEGAKAVEMLREIQSGMQFPDGRFIETKEETEQRRKVEAENPPIAPDIQLKNRELDIKAEKDEADIEVRYMEVQILQFRTEADVQLRNISEERKHYREMLKLQLVSEQVANKHFLDLQKRQDDVTVHLEAKLASVQAQRSIAAGKILAQQKKDADDGQSKMLTAAAKLREAQTHERELDSKLSGAIETGV